MPRHWPRSACLEEVQGATKSAGGSVIVIVSHSYLTVGIIEPPGVLVYSPRPRDRGGGAPTLVQVFIGGR